MTINDPYPRSKFAADGDNILISGLTNSIEFAMRVNGVTVVSETYNYDTDGKVAIRGIADMVSRCLYGTLTVADQPDAKATVDFLIDGAVVYTHTIYSSRLQNPNDPSGQKTVMSATRKTVCHPGMPFYLTFTGIVTATLYNSSGQQIGQTSVGRAGTVYTQNCDPSGLFTNWHQGACMTIGDEMTVSLDHAACEDNVQVRFLNRYDVMESLTAAYMEDKPSVQDDVSVMYGRRTRFDAKSTTEYTLKSGKLHHTDQFDTWQDLLTARKAQVYLHGQWTDIIITKANYTRRRRQFYGNEVSVSFQTANPYLTL